MRLYFKGSNAIPEAGCIQISLPGILDTSEMQLSGPAALFSGSTSVTLNGDVLKIINTGAISAGTTVWISRIYAKITGNFEFGINIFGKKTCTGVLYSSSLSIQVKPAPAFLARTKLWTSFPSLLSGERNGASHVLTFSPTFRSQLQLTDSISLEFSSPLPSSLRPYAFFTNSQGNRLISREVTIVGTLVTIAPPLHSSLAAGTWNVTLTAQDGLPLLNGMGASFSWTLGSFAESAGYYLFPVFAHFQSLTVRNLGSNAEQMTIMLVQFTATQGGQKPEIVLQFQNNTDYLGGYYTAGDLLNCTVYTGTAEVRSLVPAGLCQLRNDTGAIRTSVVITGVSSLAQGDVVEVALAGFKNPAAGTTLDLVVSTLVWSANAGFADRPTYLNRELYESAAVVLNDPAIRQVDSPSPVVGEARVSVESNWQFPLAALSGETRFIVLQFDYDVYDTTYLPTAYCLP
jgi:hypothetical protein